MLIKKSQVWIETVIYTLIVLVIIGLLLSILKPAIQSKQDQILLDKSMEMIQQIDNAIEETKYYGPGNSIPVEFQLKAGQIIINGEDDSLTFLAKTGYLYSELNQTITKGKINITTISKGEKTYQVSFKINYQIDLTWDKKQIEKVFSQSGTPQKIWVVNNGRNTENIINIDLGA